MVNDLVKDETKKYLLKRFGRQIEPVLDYAFTCKIMDINKCRIAVIKKYYRELLSDYTAGEACLRTAETFCISEKHVQAIIYNEFYKGIGFQNSQG